MPNKIAIASGKGGTGKTSVSLLLYRAIKKYLSLSVQLVDCDVEEPNDLIFFPEATFISGQRINQLIPEINGTACCFCGKCQDYCEFNAIVLIPSAGFAKITPELCHSCGACIYACAHKAIKEVPKEIGSINAYSLNGRGNPDMLEGRLKIGSAMQTLLIRELKMKVDDRSQFILYDAPPGTSCPVVASVSDADYVILVTEPTAFGLHDLKLTLDLMKEMNKKFGVFINKDGVGDGATEKYLNSRDIEILGRYPFEESFASSYAKGLMMEDISPNKDRIYKELAEKINSKFN